MTVILFRNLGPQPFEPSPVQERIGKELVQKAVDRFPWNVEVGNVLMIADVEAWSPFFQNAIRDKVTNYRSDGSRKFDILPDSFTARVMKTLGFKNNPGRMTDDSIKRIVETMEADTLLLVTFTSRDYIEDDKSASGHLSCTFYGKGGTAPVRIDVSAEQEKTVGALEVVGNRLHNMSPGVKLVCSILGVLLFPFLMAPVTLAVVRAQSARLNGFMILVYAAIIFYFEGMMFSAPESVLEALLMGAWGITIVWYLLKMCDMLASPGFKRRMQMYGGR